MVFSLAGHMRDAAVESVAELFSRPKYADASNVAFGVLDRRIAAIESKPKPALRDTELLRVLKEIRAEIDEDLVERWNNRPEFADRPEN